MGLFLIYILKSSFCLIFFYLFYKLLLSKETFHRFNRVVLLSIIVLSFIIPFFQLTITKPIGIQQNLIDMQQFLSTPMPEGGEESPLYSWATLLVLLYGTGFLFFLGRNVYAITRILSLLSGSQCRCLPDNQKLILHERAIAPFSWLNFIVISKADFDEAGDEIVVHELAHIRKKHSFDLLFVELAILFQWFNPAIWLLKHELHAIHEYQADESVLRQGIDAKKYQLLLIKKAVGAVRFNSLANSFNHSKLKKRITMMLKKKSSPWARLKFLYVIPITGIAITVFARPEVSEKLSVISEVKVSDLSESRKDKEKTIQNNKGSQENIELTLMGDSIFCSGIMDSDNNTSKVEINTADPQEPYPLYIIDGKEVDVPSLSSLEPKTIERVDVLKGESAIELYGEKGKNGVVIITLK